MNTRFHYTDFSVYSDLYKDVYGFRPRSIPFTTVAEYRAEMTQLSEMLKDDISVEKQEIKFAVDRFNQIVSDTMNTCNCSWKKAIDFLMDAEDNVYVSDDMEFFLYHYGIYGNLAYEIIRKYKEEN